MKRNLLIALAAGVTLAAVPALAELTKRDSVLTRHPRKTFHLYVNDGEWELADGTKTYIVSYVAWNDRFEAAPEGATLPKAQIPAPTIRVKQGDDVTVYLHNTGHHHLDPSSAFGNVTHTIHFHGMDVMTVYDGTPGVPTEGIPDRLLAGVPVGDSFMYRFIAKHEGTFMYHCHVDTSTHALLGMFGAFIVEGKEPNTIHGRRYDREYTLFFSEMDSEHNDAIRDVGEYDMSKFRTNYYLVNGRIFTSDLTNKLSTVADPRSLIKGKEGETILLRMLAMGWDHTFAFHPHAYHMEVVGTDGRALPAPYWKDTLPIVSGERYDVLVHMDQKKDAVCVSCRLGKGLSIAHDHNLRGETSAGKYPRGPLVVFAVE
ncbi:MAG TPA: multicopper oxidase domain-containing protein [Myxococcales bacterium]|nr:multicopper oxidase domain-containing protein [Myxococcales bacterium]